jgi:serine/threonine protein phosphatase PrpC
MKRALKNCEEKILEDGLDYSHDGTCCCLAYITKKKCIVANVGNCQAYLYRDEGGRLAPIRISDVHDMDNFQEKIRVETFGIKKIARRKWGERFNIEEDGPGISATRSLGAFKYKNVLISEPDFQVIHIDKRDVYIVMATDGLWDIMTPSEVGDYIMGRDYKEGLAEDLLDEAAVRWKASSESEDYLDIGDEPNVKRGGDDIASVIVFLK